MNVTFSCPKCERDTRSEIEPAAASLTCAACGQDISVPQGAFHHGSLARCLACPSTDLFIRKDFPQRLGVGIVVFGIAASSIAWGYSLPIATFAILSATA